jgi:hypothetical protein
VDSKQMPTEPIPDLVHREHGQVQFNFPSLHHNARRSRGPCCLPSHLAADGSNQWDGSYASRCRTLTNRRPRPLRDLPHGCPVGGRAQAARQLPASTANAFHCLKINPACLRPQGCSQTREFSCQGHLRLATGYSQAESVVCRCNHFPGAQTNGNIWAQILSEEMFQETLLPYACLARSYRRSGASSI